MTQDRRTFGAETTADDVLDGIDLSDKLALVTGGASGLGTETARALAARGAGIVIAARNVEKGEEAAQTIRDAVEGASVEVIALDLASLDSIRSAAQAFLATHDRLDLLVNNAGVMACPPLKTADGFEMQFGTNHLGHFLFTNLIASALIAAAPSRIVNLSSRGHHRDTVHFEDLHFAERDYDKWQSYGQSKTANILFTVGLDARLKDKGVRAYAVHPGGIVTNLGRHLNDDDVKFLMAQMQKNSGGNAALKSIPQGAATSCYAATAPELEGQGAVYLEDCHVAAVDDENMAGGVRSYALDPDTAEKLWAVSEDLVGDRFAY
ncbi:SDR family NAD(P)-dependent oxidoreductase [Parasphingopyxis sp. CP4]|uniref:oxidoreductase n=1 Tax=Parasphingopyxis sp. CP4 TaxID=2724527 RepID=UPI0015A221CE|nr:oxidoreductase [Parasphingopyxis sp. CP4]QLC23136.1 SDR family NAD(P)-dependent oxidoreductase [Parasphingopyxis sp. CP4]